jgi:glycolate oxidase FAD binding subunit
VSGLDALAAAVGAAGAVVAAGAGTHTGIGGAIVPGAHEVRAPSGIVSYEPSDMTVTVLAGTPVGMLDAALAERGQECPLDPRDPAATVGGVLACGLSGPRRLRTGPVRDRVLEVRFVTADGRLVRGGGPTVKNVTGYDLPRLFVGSLGTLGVLAQVTLRTQPRPACSQWFVGEGPPAAWRDRLFRPATLAWDGRQTFVRLEGHPEDVAAEQQGAGLAAHGGPSWPRGDHRGRISVRPTALGELAARLDDTGCAWLAEGGVGTVHVGASNQAALLAARAAAESLGGWLLREAGAPGIAPFGHPPPNLPLLARIKEAFDPGGKLNPGRLPYLERAA